MSDLQNNNINNKKMATELRVNKLLPELTTILDSFYNIKKWYLTNVEPNEKLIPKGVIVSVILCQYYFKCISDKNKLNVEFAENTNDYKHYFGHAKFHDKIFNIVKNKKTTI